MATGTQWPGSRATFANDIYHSGFPSVYRTPNRPWRQASWRTALSGETLDHFSAERVNQFSGLHDALDELNQTQAEEIQASTTLGDLAFAGPISPADRRDDLKTVARLDALNARMLYLARLLIDEARTAGISSTSAGEPRQRRATAELSRRMRHVAATQLSLGRPRLKPRPAPASSSAEHPVDRGAGVDRGRVVDRDDVGADVDREHQLGAAEHHRLDLLLGKLGDQRLELALAVADDAAGGQLLEDDPVDLAASSRRRSARGVIPRASSRCG